MRYNKYMNDTDIAECIPVAVNESSLSRVWNQVTKFDSGTISAYRNAEDCGDGKEYTKSDKVKRNNILKSKLLTLGYGVTKVKGTYIENFKSDNEIKVKEESFLVVDINDKGNLKRDLVVLGKEFEQDSITYSKPSGEYYLISTNTCPDGYPGEGKVGVEVRLGKPMFGKKGEFFSRVNGRPFVFEGINNSLKQLSKEYPTHIRSILHFAEQTP